MKRKTASKTEKHPSGLFVPCVGGTLSIHPPTVWPQKFKARNGSFYWYCAICGHRGFGIGRTYSKAGFTRDQVRVMCPGAIDGNGMLI